MLYTPQGEPHIQQTPAMRKYLSFYKKLMHNEKPLYFAVGLLPCSRLWGWLADNLNIPPTNAYYTWKEENMGSHPEKHYKALLNKYLYKRKKVAKANAVFRAQMQNEHDFFLSSWERRVAKSLLFERLNIRFFFFYIDGCIWFHILLLINMQYKYLIH